MLKRAFDFSAALVGLIVVAPLIVWIGFTIRRDSEGPAIFVQDRVGRNGIPFRCYKLRTMYTNTGNVPTHMANSAQVTPLGARLRRTKLDELPQLWNILRGEMSFVGPRPCLPSQTELIEERRKRGVLAVTPGITGIAQVEGIDMSDPPRLAEKDAEYLYTASFITDLGLIWRTLFNKEGQGDRVNYR